MYHFFFIHSFVNGCLGCFLVLAIVNSAAVTIEMHVFFFFFLMFLFFVDIYPGVELLDHVVVIFSFFLKETSYYFLWWLH